MMIRVTDATHTGEVRREAAILAEAANLSERERGELAIVVSEIVTNLIKHVGEGCVILDLLSKNGYSGVRIVGLDKGSGIKDMSAAFRDGYSSAGTAGNGLGAIKRLSPVFDIYAAPGLGTAVLAEFWHQGKKNDHVSALDLGVQSIPIPGENDCGDGWGMKNGANSTLFMVVDGLGHGILASDAAREAEAVFHKSKSDSLTSILRDSHDALKKTRGAAMAVAALNLDRRVLTFAGIGNIGASIVTPAGSRGMASHNGTVGHHLSTLQEFSFPWTPESILIMYSDGLKSNWDLNEYPGIWSKKSALIAAILCRDFSRNRDDLTVLVAKNCPESGAP
jgi:anti-sigma regulatory factor (Ser/Thr protein kinase)